MESNGQDASDTTQSTADLTAFVQNLLQQMVSLASSSPFWLKMQSRFQTMSDSIITKIDEMGNRIDDLEKSIGELIKDVGVDTTTAAQPSAPQLSSPKNNRAT